MVFEEEVQISFSEAVKASGGVVEGDGDDNGGDGEAVDGDDPLSSFLDETSEMGEDNVSDSKKRKLHHKSGDGENKNNDAPQQQQQQQQQQPKKKKQKKKDFKSSNSKKWVYCTGFPPDVTALELATHFSKCGVLTLDPITQEPKIKIYKDKSGTVKGDGSICFAREESVPMCIDLLDGVALRAGDETTILTVKEAEFKQVSFAR